MTKLHLLNILCSRLVETLGFSEKNRNFANPRLHGHSKEGDNDFVKSERQWNLLQLPWREIALLRKLYYNKMDESAQGRWESCLQYIKDNLPPKSYDTWFTIVKFVSLSGNKLTIGVPTKYVYEYIEEHFQKLLHESISMFFGEKVKLLYHLDNEETPKENEAISIAKTRVAHEQPSRPSLDPHLDSEYNFEDYVEGESNKLARSVALAIADLPGQNAFNPFFLYGPSGVGKTHLANAIGLRILDRMPAKRVLLVSAHKFQTQYTDSVIHNKFNDFIAFYQSIDVLIIDDVQELTTQKTQQAFFHIFNHLQQNKRQIIMTCDRPPVLLEGMEERMLTRFKWGMVAELERPDTHLRMAILNAKIKRDRLSIPGEVTKYIVQNVDQSVRDLQGIVNAIMAYSVVYNCDIDLQLASRVVGRIVNLEKKDLSISDITEKVCSFYGVKHKEISSKSRKQTIVQARQVAMFLCRKYTEQPTLQIGRAIGGRDHSTVLHSCKQIERRISTDKRFRKELEEIECSLKK